MEISDGFVDYNGIFINSYGDLVNLLFENIGFKRNSSVIETYGIIIDLVCECYINHHVAIEKNNMFMLGKAVVNKLLVSNNEIVSSK